MRRSLEKFTKRPLRIADLGKNGDQLVRMFSLQAEVFVVQSNGPVDGTVYNHIQAQVAEKIGTTQSAVARMESGRGNHSPSLATLSRYAEALGCKLEVKLIRGPGQTRNLTDRPSTATRKRVAA